MLAVPVTLPIDTGRGTPAASEVALTLQVTQMGLNGSPVVASLAGKLVLRNLPELDMATKVVASLARQYSRVDLMMTALSFDPAVGPTPVAIRAVGSIDVGDVSANGAAPLSGPGGGSGGIKGAKGEGLGGGRPAGALTGGLLTAASGGGYGAVGGPGGALGNPTANPGGLKSGDDLITSYLTNTSGGGGGGDNDPGGGGGGTIELTAGGQRQIEFSLTPMMVEVVSVTATKRESAPVTCFGRPSVLKMLLRHSMNVYRLAGSSGVAARAKRKEARSGATNASGS